jgi:hypothetical protein
VGFFSRIFGRGDDQGQEPSRGMSKEHRQGRSLEEILEDPYLKNRATEEQRLRLLELPEVIRAVGEDTAAMAAQHVRESH